MWRDDTRLERVLSLEDLKPGTVYLDYAADRIWVADDPTGADMEISVTPSALRSGSNERGTAGVRLSGLVVERFANQAQAAPAVEMGPGWVAAVLEAELVVRPAPAGDQLQGQGEHPGGAHP